MLGSPTRPSMEAKRAVSSPQTKAPAPRLIWTSKVKARAQDVFAQEPQAPGLFDGDSQVLDRQRIFHAHIDITLAGPQGEGPDNHPLQNGMGITLHEGPVHEGPRIPFVAIPHNIDRPRAQYGSIPGPGAT